MLANVSGSDPEIDDIHGSIAPSSPPQPPEDVRVVNNTLVWKPAAGHIRAWTIYQKNGNNWKLLRVRDASVKQTSVFPGTYAVCSVDRFANESRGVVVEVS